MASKIDPTAFIHPLADVEDNVTIGKRTKVWRWSHIMSGAVIGDDCVISQGCFVAGTVVIGNGCHIQNNVNLYDGCVLGNFVFIGPNSTTTNVKFPRSHRKGKFEKTIFKDNSSVGAGVVIVCGTTLGEFCMIGASSCVTKDVPPGVTSFGVPATVKKNKNHHLEKLNI